MNSFLIALLCWAFLPTHDYYISTTNVRVIPESQQIQLTSRFFIDDIEALMQSKTGENIQLQPDTDSIAIDQFVAAFYQENLTIEWDGKPQDIKYLGREYQDDLLVVYAEIQPFPSAVDELFFTVTFLTDFLPSQQNIIHFSAPSSKKSVLLNQAKTTHRIFL